MARVRSNRKPKLTDFVRTVVLPGSAAGRPRLDRSACRFRLLIGPSRIDRWGVFAAEAIPARRRVVEYTGERIGLREAFRRRVRHRLYLFRTGERRYVDGAIGGSGAEYINHGCEPNLVARVRKGRVMMVSLRRIAAGEELLLDYRVSGDVPLEPCRCGAPGCRGYQNMAPVS
jgi:SET domain-containing protein